MKSFIALCGMVAVMAMLTLQGTAYACPA